MPRSGSRTPSSARVAAQRSGHRAEMVAAMFLRAKFYTILDRGFRTPVGEVDIVARRGSTIVFVEVKARRHASSEGETLEAVNQRRIVRAADFWLARHPTMAVVDFRFDVIFLAPGRWPRHLVNAFSAS